MKIAVVIVLALLSSCAAPRRVDSHNYGNKLSYFKDGYGLCYAALASSSYGGSYIVTITNVPCDKVGL